MKCSLGISDFLKEVSSLSHSIVFLYFFALITEEGFVSLLPILWNSAFKWVYLSFPPLLFTSPLLTAICKASSDSHFAFLQMIKKLVRWLSKPFTDQINLFIFKFFLIWKNDTQKIFSHQNYPGLESICLFPFLSSMFNVSLFVDLPLEV